MKQTDDDDDDDYLGPFSEYRAEIGLLSRQLRFRIKLDYRIKDAEARLPHPALHLKTLTVCREALGRWPRSPAPSSSGGGGGGSRTTLSSEALFGAPGAAGGLYDPPPVGCETQATRYMLLDLEGRATVLFPYLLDQDPSAFDGNGWVSSLDWSPGTQRYQVDRKVKGGAELLGLRTLELSEVQAKDADTYRPRDGGADMRQ